MSSNSQPSTEAKFPALSIQMKVPATWEQLAAAKRSSLAASIPPEWRIPVELMPAESVRDVTTFPETSGWFTDEELAITNSSAVELLPNLASGGLTSEAVTRAFCKRAAAAHQLTNCLSETLFDRAISTAKKLDAHLARTGKPIGPLHGLPISLKDCFNLSGLDSTIGFVGYINDPAKEDAAQARLLESAGAVFYVKTNVPTGMMIAETVNNVLGRTTNPQNRLLTSGGSSGGESALVAFKGSVIGVGTDIGGSVRIPAACTGIWALRPSFGRFPGLGCRSPMPGQEAVQAVNGPMARSLVDLEHFCKVVVDAQPWNFDPWCVPLSWRKVDLPAPLRIGVMKDDGMVTPTPPVARALQDLAGKLRDAGHEVVDWLPHDHSVGLDFLQRMFVADGGKAVRKAVEASGEPLRPEMMAYEEGQFPDASTYEMWKLHLERTEFQDKYLKRWLSAGLDALLCPTTPFSGVANGGFRHIGYTGVFNILDYSCVSFPTGILADKELDLYPTTYSPRSETCRKVQADYDPELVHGMPVSLQLVARKLEEEKLLEMCKKVAKVLDA